MAAGNTYTPIATTTLGSAVASYTFSSIPGTYTDLVLVVNYGSASTGNNISVQVGNASVDTGTNYSDTCLYGTGASANSNRNTTNTVMRLSVATTAETAISATSISQFMNYANTTTNKTMLTRHGTAVAGSFPGTEAVVNLWRSTAAINIITVSSTANFVIGSTFTLYGISCA